MVLKNGRVKVTPQMEAWLSGLGNDYYHRHKDLTPQVLDEAYTGRTHQTRRGLNRIFLDTLPRDTRILEIGCGNGLQLELLRLDHFSDLWGVELRARQVALARDTGGLLNVVIGSCFDIPFKDCWADLVFTSGLLMHISEDDIEDALREIYRVSGGYIWGYEYFSEEPEVFNWRDTKETMFTRNYTGKLLSMFSDLILIREEKFSHKDGVDTMYMLKKV